MLPSAKASLEACFRISSMFMLFVNKWEDSAQQWPELIRVLLATIPNFQSKKGDTK
jgi:hypothetical protein